MFVDSHIHLTHPSFEGEVPCIMALKPVNGSEDGEGIIEYLNREQLIGRLKDCGISFCIEPAIGIESNYLIRDVADKYTGFIYPAVGVHPTRTCKAKWSRRKQLPELATKEDVVAIGELGLDYHHERREQHRLIQKMWFIWQIKLADQLNLPLILHIRMADKDAVRILRHYKKIIHGGVCHCFYGNAEMARVYTQEFGFMLGIGGSILQDAQTELIEAVKETPLEYLILETDGPFVKPDKPDDITGKKWKKARNTGAIIPDIAKKIADIKGIDVSMVESATNENVKRVFGIE